MSRDQRFADAVRELVLARPESRELGDVEWRELVASLCDLLGQTVVAAVAAMVDLGRAGSSA